MRLNPVIDSSGSVNRRSAEVRPASGSSWRLAEEHDLEEQGQEERRQRNADDRHEPDAHVRRAPSPAGRQDPQGDAQRDRDDHRGDDQFERRRQATEDLVEDRPLGPDRRAPVPGQHVAHVGQVLDRQRLVESELAGHPLDVLGPGPRPDVERRRVRRDHPGEHEGDDRHAEEDDGGASEPVEQEPFHLVQSLRIDGGPVRTPVGEPGCRTG